jgi:N-acetyl-alpha-D-glucosaminyl L-malate synthase BshA
VIDVFRRMVRDVPARLILVGDGPERDAIERQAREAGLHGRVIFVGEERDLVRRLSVSDVFLQPSNQESFGLAALEAMACEVPVIASRVGGLPEIVIDGVTGYACAPDDAEQMAIRGVELLRDPGGRMAMGRTAAAFVHERYCTARIVPMYEEAYQRALG